MPRKNKPTSPKGCKGKRKGGLAAKAVLQRKYGHCGVQLKGLLIPYGPSPA